MDGFIFRQEYCLIKKSDKEDYRKYFNKGTTDMHQSTELRTCSTDTLGADSTNKINYKLSNITDSAALKQWIF